MSIVEGLRFAVGCSLGTALAALAVLHVSAPDYLLHQGFPLDDAWIHAVYAREFAVSGMLAYNPGVSATGETSPLWAVVLASVHRLAAEPWLAVALTKALGFLLHAASAACLAATLRAVSAVKWPVVLSAALVAFHPDLVSGSISGMEVPLATLIIVGIVAATLRNAWWLIAALGAAAVVGRPETAVIALAFPLLFRVSQQQHAGARLSVAAAAGVVVSGVALALRNHAVSGMFLPATFHAKVDVASPFGLNWQIAGFRGLLGQLPLVNSLAIIAAMTGVSLALLSRPATTPAGRAGAAMCLSGLAYCAISFVIVHPFDPVAFYHQRYVLPALFCLVASLPLIVYEIMTASTAEAGASPAEAATGPAKAATRPAKAGHYVYALAVLVMAGVLVHAAPARYRRLSNDARNIDDVQVALGRSLQSASPSQSAWVVDAGAPRFFGKAFVIDLVGLNTPEILRPDAQSFLAAHRPRYLDRFEGWSEIEGGRISTLPVRSFEATTPYTVTGDARMRKHELLTCEPPGLAGRIKIRGRTFSFQCL